MQTTNGKLKLNGIDEHVARYLLAHSPEYRALVKARVSEVKKRQRLSDRSILSAFRSYHGDVDLLGRDIDGCG